MFKNINEAKLETDYILAIDYVNTPNKDMADFNQDYSCLIRYIEMQAADIKASGRDFLPETKAQFEALYASLYERVNQIRNDDALLAG